MNRQTKLSAFTSLVMLALFFSSQLYAKEINYKKLYQEAAPAVVLVYGETGKTAGTGTGSILSESGLVLTNAHVALKDMNNRTQWDRLFVFLKPEKVTGNLANDLKHRHEGRLLAVHPEYDFALVQIVNPPKNLPSLPLSDLSNIEIGESTVAIGHPGGGAKWTLTTGRLSASWEDFNNVKGRDVFQTETPINPGNSGGPLLDGSMNIIGINTFIMRQNKTGMALTGLNYAVKATTARDWITSVLGQLPKESLAAKSTHSNTAPPPKPEKIAAAPPPAPKSEVRPTTHSAQKQTQLYVEPTKKPHKTPSVTLAQPKPKNNAYHSKARPGVEYKSSEIDRLHKKMAKAFDELDAEVEEMGWGSW